MKVQFLGSLISRNSKFDSRRTAESTMRPTSVCWRNVRWVRRYACRCETLVAMAFASSFYLYIKWRESKTTSSANPDATHKLQFPLQYTRLTHLWQQYSRIFAATATLPVSSRSPEEADIRATVGNEVEIEKKRDRGKILSVVWYGNSIGGACQYGSSGFSNTKRDGLFLMGRIRRMSNRGLSGLCRSHTT